MPFSSTTGQKLGLQLNFPSHCLHNNSRTEVNLTVEIKIGTVSHYYSKLSVAILELAGELKVGDQIRVKGHTSDFTQTIDSMQVDDKPVAQVGPGQGVGIKVPQHAREHDVVYKVTG